MNILWRSIAIVYGIGVAGALISIMIGLYTNVAPIYSYVFSLGMYLVLIINTLSFEKKGTKIIVLPSIFWIVIALMASAYYTINYNIHWDESNIWSYIIFARIFTSAFFEELFFRKFVVDHLVAGGFKNINVAFLSCFLFSLWHIINLARAPFSSVINQMIYAFVMGLLYYLTAKVANSWSAAILPHVLSNLMLGSYSYFDLSRHFVE